MTRQKTVTGLAWITRDVDGISLHIGGTPPILVEEDCRFASDSWADVDTDTCEPVDFSWLKEGECYEVLIGRRIK